MKWDEIRKQLPASWLLVEALSARSEAGMRVVDDFAIVEHYPDSASAMQSYARLHHEAPDRELYVLHTSRVAPDIHERIWHGIRSAS